MPTDPPRPADRQHPADHHPRMPLRLRAAHGLLRLSARLRSAEPELLGLGALVRPGDHVIDVGAAYGMYSLPLAALVGPTGSVSGFEPIRRQWRLLRAARALTAARWVTATHAAIGPEPGEHTMILPIRFGLPIYGHTHVGTGTERALTPQAPRTRRWSVRMESVDAWCASRGIREVSFIKVDVEGFEPSVVEGARRTIDAHRPSLLLEIEERHLGRYGMHAADFVAEMHARWPDYRLYSWVGGRWVATPEVTLTTRNYLFAVPSRFSPAAEGPTPENSETPTASGGSTL